MKKTRIILLVLLITTTFIGCLRYFIKKDSEQTKEERLKFFSENLSTNTNKVISTFENYAAIVVSGISKDKTLTSNLIQLSTANQINKPEIIKAIYDSSQNYFLCLKEVGCTSLAYIVKTKSGKILRIVVSDTTSFNTIEIFPVANKSTGGFYPQISFNETNLAEYLTYTPLSSNTSVLIETGTNITLLRQILMDNMPGYIAGYMFKGNDTLWSSFPSLQSIFIQPDKNFTLYFDKNFLSEFDSHISPKTLKEIEMNLHESSGEEESKSIYVALKKNAKALSLCKINFSNLPNEVYIVTLNDDFVLDKTNDWDNQILIINITIIILIMLGVIYLFLNRLKLITEKRNVEDSEMKLKEMNESKDKFFSIIAHDLKNPFNGIMGMTGYLNESYDDIDDQERKDIINELNISSKNAFNLLQNLLEWTRTQSGTIKNIPVKIEPVSIIEIALETVYNLAKNKEIEIKQTIETEKVGYADENLVATVLRNLFTNAVKFSPRKSTIEVNVKSFEKELVFSVKDSGTGLRHDEIDQLFRIDLNFHKKGTEDETGTGLGLKICKEFVEYCHGRIWVISEPNKGSCFYFTIPQFIA